MFFTVIQKKTPVAMSLDSILFKSYWQFTGSGFFTLWTEKKPTNVEYVWHEIIN